MATRNLTPEFNKYRQASGRKRPMNPSGTSNAALLGGEMHGLLCPLLFLGKALEESRSLLTGLRTLNVCVRTWMILKRKVVYLLSKLPFS